MAGAAVCASVTREECGVIDMTGTISINHIADLLMTVLLLNNIMKGGQQEHSLSALFGQT